MEPPEQDLTDWLIRILDENNNPMQDASDLAGIRQDCLAPLDNLDDELAGIERALRAAASR